MTSDRTLDLKDAIRALSELGVTVPAGAGGVPGSRGIYALRADAQIWRLLGLEQGTPEQPLYVGKAERSLRSRDVQTHFETGKTGSSTVRRSFAALLAETIGIESRPRNPSNPSHFSNFGLERTSDARLSEWMSANIRLAYWTAPSTGDLRPLEIELIRWWQPPLNLTDVDVPLAYLRSARKRLAHSAEQWSIAQSSGEQVLPFAGSANDLQR